MYLFFDLTGEKNVVIQSFLYDTWKKAEFPYDNEDALLSGISEVLKDNGKEMSDLSGVGVKIGKGRFTAVRVAVTVANTLGYALNIPVVSYADEALDLVLKRLGEAKTGVYVHAEYSGPASIGNK